MCVNFALKMRIGFFKTAADFVFVDPQFNMIKFHWKLINDKLNYYYSYVLVSFG